MANGGRWGICKMERLRVCWNRYLNWNSCTKIHFYERLIIHLSRIVYNSHSQTGNITMRAEDEAGMMLDLPQVVFLLSAEKRDRRATNPTKTGFEKVKRLSNTMPPPPPPPLSFPTFHIPINSGYKWRVWIHECVMYFNHKSISHLLGAQTLSVLNTNCKSRLFLGCLPKGEYFLKIKKGTNLSVVRLYSNHKLRYTNQNASFTLFIV